MDTPSIETSPADVPLTSGETYLPEPKSAEHEALLGKTLDGRFRVEALIGKGTMGRVYRAVQLPLNRPVALKVLDSNYGAGREPSFRQRFLVEAALTARLSHPNTVRIFDYGCTVDGIFYLAMEYLDGATLERVLTRGPLGWRVALSIAQQLSRALREAHALGVVHRDLKPANIMLLHADDDTEHVKVLDFGLVKSFVEGRDLDGRVITQQGTLVGSPPYMAPEQAERNQADPRSDLYSLGVMLYEMLTGRLPFPGRRPLEVIFQHLNDPVPPLVTPRGLETIPATLAAVVLRCLAKSPMDRFQSIDELLAALGEVRGEGAAASPARAGQASPGRGPSLQPLPPDGDSGPPAAPLPRLPASPRGLSGPLRPEGFPPDSPIGALQLWPPHASARPRPSPPGRDRDAAAVLPFPRRATATARASRGPWEPAHGSPAATGALEGRAQPGGPAPRLDWSAPAVDRDTARASSADTPAKARSPVLSRSVLTTLTVAIAALAVGLLLGVGLWRGRPSDRSSGSPVAFPTPRARETVAAPVAPAAAAPEPPAPAERSTPGTSTGPELAPTGAPGTAPGAGERVGDGALVDESAPPAAPATSPPRAPHEVAHLPTPSGQSPGPASPRAPEAPRAATGRRPRKAAPTVRPVVGPAAGPRDERVPAGAPDGRGHGDALALPDGLRRPSLEGPSLSPPPRERASELDVDLGDELKRPQH